jgi:hypothetical protein
MTCANKKAEQIDENRTILLGHHPMDCIEYPVARKMNGPQVYI